ncbi:unnamed protein product [Didymodactylos carnosus]|uniref:Uncharacterized protein n=1 Tax=Didymodactylos carnosus TaxID=1234261 RepID=A0A8S2D9G8_9BILA|nr:unnamed protein product [Didymodactylos carnosus]CAF3621503.1 unnamed protein product [Didymodactylos carnosus]
MSLNQQHFPNKDRLNNNQLSGVIYKIDYNDCAVDYVGKCIRQTCRRTMEHEKDVQKTELYLSTNIRHLSTAINKNKNKNNKNISHGRILKETNDLRRSQRIAKQNLTQTNYSLSESTTDYKPKSALGKHVLQTDHSINFSKININMVMMVLVNIELNNSDMNEQVGMALGKNGEEDDGMNDDCGSDDGTETENEVHDLDI